MEWWVKVLTALHIICAVTGPTLLIAVYHFGDGFDFSYMSLDAFSFNVILLLGVVGLMLCVSLACLYADMATGLNGYISGLTMSIGQFLVGIFLLIFVLTDLWHIFHLYGKRCEGCPLEVRTDYTSPHQWVYANETGAGVEAAPLRLDPTKYINWCGRYDEVEFFQWQPVEDLKRCFTWGCDPDRISKSLCDCDGCIGQRADDVETYRIIITAATAVFFAAGIVGVAIHARNKVQKDKKEEKQAAGSPEQSRVGKQYKYVKLDFRKIRV